MQTSSYRAVFLSPHLDDAVFSCGGTIAKLVSEGPVLVLNVFSRYTGDVQRGPVVIHRGRHAEEANAASLLGFRSDCLNEVDAALRDPAYQHPANLFRPPVQQDEQHLPRLSGRICDYLAGIEYDHLYLPLGVGWHVDHLVCHLATQSLHENARVLFYEDAPYCLVPNFTNYRLREIGLIGGRDEGTKLGSKGFVSDWYEAIRYYAGMAPMRRMGPWLMRAGAVTAVSVFFWRLLSSHSKLWVSEATAQRYQLTPRTNDIADCFSRKIDGCFEYRSQIREFFLNRRDCESRYRKYSALLAPHSKNLALERGVYERFWAFEAGPSGSRS